MESVQVIPQKESRKHSRGCINTSLMKVENFPLHFLWDVSHWFKSVVTTNNNIQLHLILTYTSTDKVCIKLLGNLTYLSNYQQTWSLFQQRLLMKSQNQRVDGNWQTVGWSWLVLLWTLRVSVGASTQTRPAGLSSKGQLWTGWSWGCSDEDPGGVSVFTYPLIIDMYMSVATLC